MGVWRQVFLAEADDQVLAVMRAAVPDEDDACSLCTRRVCTSTGFAANDPASISRVAYHVPEGPT